MAKQRSNTKVVATTDEEILAQNSDAEGVEGSGEISISETVDTLPPQNSTVQQDPVSARKLSINTQSSPDTEGAHLPGSKNVPIRVSEPIRCRIGRWYEFVPGKTYRVPENVKLVLKRRKVLEVL